MTNYVAMLRGINVSGQKPIKMERLRAALTALGFGDVRTYIQSGNAVFTATKTTPARLEKQIATMLLAEFSFEVSVLVRTPEELTAVLKANPFPGQKNVDESRLYVAFLSEVAPKAAHELLQPLASRTEQFSVQGREIFLHLPDGAGETKLSNAAIEKKLSLRATSRNWRTTTILAAMGRGEKPE